MPGIFHLKKVSFVNGRVRVEINLKPLWTRVAEAQQWLGDRVLEDCKPFMPHLTGSMQQRSHTENGGRWVVFPGPYARMQYGGRVMVDSVTGKGPRRIPTAPGEYIYRYRKGAKLVPSTRRLTYSRAEATDHWFDPAKARNGRDWINGVKRITGGK